MMKKGKEKIKLHEYIKRITPYRLTRVDETGKLLLNRNENFFVPKEFQEEIIQRSIKNIDIRIYEEPFNLKLLEKLSEYHTGYRAYHKRVLETIPYIRNSNDFVFDQQFLFQAATFGFRIKEIPVGTRYFSDASTISFSRSVHYGISTLILSMVYLRHCLGWKSNLFIR